MDFSSVSTVSCDVRSCSETVYDMISLQSRPMDVM